MPRSSPLTPQVQVAFLAALRRGVLVEAAAACVGVAVSTLYWRRKRDPLFGAAWSAAARLGRGAGTGRRIRFAEDDKSRFLETLPGDCNTAAAARRIRFHPATVYRHLGRDPAFARGNEAALQSGYERLGRAAEEELAARSERLRASLQAARTADARGDEGNDFDSLIRRLDRYSRPDGSIGRRIVRWPAARNIWSFDRAILELDRRLGNLGLRRRAERPEGAD